MPTTPLATRILVITGASGFLGRVVAFRAKASGWRVFAASRSAAPEPGIHEAWWRIPEGAGIEVLSEWLQSIRPDAVFHAAGSANVRASFDDPWEDLQASLGSWSLWLEAARRSGGKPLMIFPSSAAVYGIPKTLPVAEDSPLRPISPYGVHKLMCERLAQEYHEMLGLPVAVLRLFSIFGASQKRLLVWEVFRKLMEGSGCVRLMGTGNERRDYLHEDAVARAILLLGEDRERWARETKMPVFNIGSGVEHRVAEVAGLLRDHVMPDCRIVCDGQSRHGDPERWCADIRWFQAAYPGWRPLGLAEGLRPTVHSWMQAGNVMVANI